jgi:hypothetical protein
MTRSSLALTLVAAFLATTALGAADAQAGRKKHRRRPAAPVVTAANARALGELMGPFKFGMTTKEILKVLAKQIDEKYAEKIKATEDVYKQDQLRRDKQAELNRVKKSYIEFKGKKTGWDVSIIDDQFAHNTDESMMVFWENEPGSGKDQRRFFFFKDGHLYKMFIALNSGMLKGEQRNFGYFQDIMVKRYGTGTVRTVKDRDGAEHAAGIDWRTKSYHVSALDKLEFHGSFCLVIADPATEKQVADLRAANAPPPRTNKVIDSVTNGDGTEPDDPSLDENKATLDAILKSK